jgi:hypothetical protein
VERTPECPNCGAEALGDFCAACGQQQGELFPTLGEWLKSALNELFVVDRKLFRTLQKLAWPPGELTLEWKRGRRSTYVAPFRLYLATALFFFLGFHDSSLQDILSGFTAGYVEGAGSTGPEAAQIELGTRILTETLPGVLMVVLVPLFALFLKSANRMHGTYVEHLVTALNYHAFAFLVWVLAGGLDALFGDRDPGLILALVLNSVFLVATIARVQTVGVVRASIRAVFVAAAYFAVSLATVGAALVVVLGI